MKILEIKMLRNTKDGLMIILSSILGLILGFLLLVSLDGYKPYEISLNLFEYSVYTVYTQFGFFIFPIIPMYIISNEYKNKNIIFYQKLNYTPIKFIINKILSIMVFFTIGNLIISLLMGAIYQQFSNIFLFFMKIQNVSFYIVTISIVIVYLLGNFIKSFCANFALWILGIVLSTINIKLSIFCFYDATLLRHTQFEQILEKYLIFDKSIISEIVYNSLVFIISIFIISIFKKGGLKMEYDYITILLAENRNTNCKIL